MYVYNLTHRAIDFFFFNFCSKIPTNWKPYIPHQGIPCLKSISVIQSFLNLIQKKNKKKKKSYCIVVHVRYSKWSRINSKIISVTVTLFL